MTGPKVQPADGWGSSLLALILATAGAFRLAQLDSLAPFIDETAGLALGLDYQSWDVWSRLLHGKLLGYLWFKPILLLAWEPLYAARLVSGLVGIVSVALCYWLFTLLSSRKAAPVGTAFFAFMPLVVFHDRLALFDPFVVVCLLAALLLYLRSTDDRPLDMISAGFLFGIAVFTKGYAFLALLVWLPVLRRRAPARFKALPALGLGFLVCVLLMGVFLAAQLKESVANPAGALGAPERFFAPDLSVGQRAGMALEHLAQIFGYLHGHNGWAFVLVVVLCALLPGRQWKLRLELLVTWILFCLVLAFGFRFLFSRYLLVGLPSLALLVTLTLDDCLEMTSQIPRRLKARALFGFLLLLGVCGALFLHRDTRIAAGSLDRVLPARDAYQYLWGAPSGFGLREIAGQLERLDLADSRKLICVTRGMGVGTHGAATLPLLLRHTPIRFVHVWLQSDEDVRAVQTLAGACRVVFFVDDPEFLSPKTLSRLGGESDVLFEIKGMTGRPDYRLVEFRRSLSTENPSTRMKP